MRVAISTSAWCAGFDVVLEMHVFGKSVRAWERFITLGELASEAFFTRVGSEVREKCDTRSLRVATTSALGPFTGVVGFVHANVISMYVAYERVQVVEGIAAVFPFTGEVIECKFPPHDPALQVPSTTNVKT